MPKKHNIRLRIYLLGLYLLILPIDATLGNIIGSISIINYLVLLYVGVRLVTLLKEKIKVSSLVKCRMPFIYFVYFMLSISWAMSKGTSDWYIFSLIGCFMMFFFAAIDTYTNDEYRVLRKSVLFSGIVVIITTLWGLDLNSGTRFVLNIGRYMDPNYFATGFILITAILVDNIFKKINVKLSMVVLVLLFIIIVMTGSRGGLLANSIVILTLIAINKKHQFKKLLIIFSGVLVFGILFYSMKDLIPEWVLNRFTVNAMVSGGGSGRLTIWLSNLSYFENMPLLGLLFGNGFSTFSYISLITLGTPKVAHSIYIQSLIEGGLIGLLFIFMLIIIAMKNSWVNKNKYVFAALVGAAIGGITLDIHVSRIFWIILFFSTLPHFERPKKQKLSSN